MRRKVKHKNDEADVDMTPMLDIVFIMLIFFIVTTSFVKEKGVDLERPTNAPNKSKEKSINIAIKISPTDEVTMDNRPVNIQQVEANVETKKAQHPKATVMVQTHKAASTNTVIQVVDAAKKAGVDKISIATIAD